MLAVWKLPIDLDSHQDVLVPEGGQILTAQMQGSVLTLWALVCPTCRPQRRRIEIYGTGHLMEKAPRDYIGTVQAGTFVWHIFERL